MVFVAAFWLVTVAVCAWGYTGGFGTNDIIRHLHRIATSLEKSRDCYLDSIRDQNRRVVVSVEIYDPTGKSSVMRRGATFEEAVKQVKEAMEKMG